MILKGLKEKSNQKFINKLLDSRQNTLSDHTIESVGILLNMSEFDDFEAFRSFLQSLNIHPNKIKLIGYVKDSKLAESLSEIIFSPKQIGWKGKLKDNGLQTFVNTAFDALISYYSDDDYELSLITAASKAHFKIGLYEGNQRLNDLILNINPKDFKLFKEELVKYLTLLKKI